jgi:hypothetical protein
MPSRLCKRHPDSEINDATVNLNMKILLKQLPCKQPSRISISDFYFEQKRQLKRP